MQNTFREKKNRTEVCLFWKKMGGIGGRCRRGQLMVLLRFDRFWKSQINEVMFFSISADQNY